MKRLAIKNKKKELLDKKKNDIIKRFNAELKKQGLEDFMVRRVTLGHIDDIDISILRCCRPGENPVSMDQWGNIIQVCRVC